MQKMNRDFIQLERRCTFNWFQRNTGGFDGEKGLLSHPSTPGSGLGGMGHQHS